MTRTQTQAKETTRVLYNADCPVCSFEIDHYAAYARKQGLALRFEDLNRDDLADWQLDADTAARRLYVMKDGRRLSGLSAFLALWEEMPRYRWLAKLVGLPGLRHVAEWIYDRLLAPAIYRWQRARLARRRAVQDRE